MEGGYSRMDEEVHPQLLDLIPKEKEWGVLKEDHHDAQGSKRNHGHGDGGVSDEKKLELRLGPPGAEDWTLSAAPKNNFKSPAKPAASVPNTSQKRSAPAPVVGWPPIRSFRRNIASSSSAKQAPPPEPQNVVVPNNNVVKREKMVESCHKGFFVKINMDGVPIGRKVDLKAYDSYGKLSAAVDDLFRGLLAAQRDTYGDGQTKSHQDEEKAITGLLDGSGEYTLVYEDNEGDRMLAGDVPWHMFVSTVKRLRVLKTSELSKLCLGGSKREKT